MSIDQDCYKIPNMTTLSFKEIGEGNPIVLIHALPLSGKMWEKNARIFAEEGFRVILPDLPGFGKTPASSETLSLENAAKQVRQLLDELEIEKAIIGGLSMGGYVTFNLLRLHPDRFLGAIFCDTTSAAEPPENIENRDRLIKMISEIGSQALIDVMFPNLISEHTKENNQELVSKLKADFLECDPKAATAALRGFVKRKDHNYLLPEISVPTLLIFGEHDKITTIETGHKMAKAIPNAKLVVIPDAGHYSNLENPDVFNAGVLEFLEIF